jgi:hypothetical protein
MSKPSERGNLSRLFTSFSSNGQGVFADVSRKYSQQDGGAGQMGFGSA